MSVYVDEKQVVRYEVYCDECDYLVETSDLRSAHDHRYQHEMVHRARRQDHDCQP